MMYLQVPQALQERLAWKPQGQKKVQERKGYRRKAEAPPYARRGDRAFPHGQGER